MYSRTGLAFRYLQYWLRASSGRGHGTHSPFIYSFIRELLMDHRDYPDYERVEALRKKLIQDKSLLEYRDLGAGSAYYDSKKVSVSSIARRAAKPKKFGQLLYRMIKKYQPKTILELGTSLGITSSYLALGNPEGRLLTMEGVPALTALAKKNIESLGLGNVEVITGNFDTDLEPLLGREPSVDFAFIDGNHRQEPTENYFTWLLPKIHKDSVLVFDDIHWSRGMEGAWETIRSHPRVTCSVDLFFIGILFFREEFREKQRFTIRF